MNNLTLAIVKFGAVNISVKMISQWIKSHFIKGILYALRKGDKHIRILAIEGLGEIGHKEFVPLLKQQIKSPFVNECWAAIKAYQKVCEQHRITIPEETKILIVNTLEKCEEYFEEIRKHGSGNFQYGYNSAHTNTINILKDNQMGIFPYGT